MAEDAFLTQIVTQPTRENSILDLAFESDPDLIRDCKVGEKLSGPILPEESDPWKLA